MRMFAKACTQYLKASFIFTIKILEHYLFYNPSTRGFTILSQGKGTFSFVVLFGKLSRVHKCISSFSTRDSQPLLIVNVLLFGTAAASSIDGASILLLSVCELLSRTMCAWLSLSLSRGWSAVVMKRPFFVVPAPEFISYPRVW